MISQEFKLKNIRNLANIFMFVIFLLPVSFISGISSNYSFVLYPLVIIFFKSKVLIPNKLIIGSIVFYFILFMVSFFVNTEYNQFYVRRIVSFFIFMSIFCFLFINIDRNKLTAFKIAIVLYSLIYIIPNVITFFFAEASSLDVNLKAQFGSQRYGFIYIMAFWIIYLHRPKAFRWYFVSKYTLLVLLLIGILLTFSRSSIVSLLMSFIVYFIYESYINKKYMLERLKNISISIFIFICIFSFAYLVAPFLIEFFIDTFFLKIFEENTDGFDLFNENSSIGYRLYMFYKIVNFISISPFVGSGYLGVWVFFESLEGSAHNQYSDVIFRVGIFGFIIYMLLINRVVFYLHKYEQGLFFGFIAVLFYGLFHETFKLSHGAFLLSFLLALTFQKKLK